MDKLTARQEEFLLFFASRNGSGSFVSEAAERFDVSKATVSVACTALTKYQMLEKGLHGGFHLTEKGFEYIGEKLALAKEVARCFTSKLGMSPYIAEMESRRMVVSLLPETIKAIISVISDDYAYDGVIHKDVNKSISDIFPVVESPLSVLADGAYNLPFRVCRADTRTLSMGDRGFTKPAGLVKNGSDIFIKLYPARFSYRPDHRKPLAGSLERLWYHHSGLWTECTLTDEKCYIIPCSVMNFTEDKENQEGIIRIVARATVGLRNMPESQADIIFDLNGIQPE